MKAKKFIKKLRKLLGPARSEIAQFLGGDSSTMKHRGLLLNLQVLCEEYVVLERARRAKLTGDLPAKDERFALTPSISDLRKKGVNKVQITGGYQVTLPKGYLLLLGQNTTEWSLMRRGHLVGQVSQVSDKTDADFGETLHFSDTHASSDVGHDCINSLQDAVDSLISTHEEYIASKNKRKLK